MNLGDHLAGQLASLAQPYMPITEEEEPGDAVAQAFNPGQARNKVGEWGAGTPPKDGGAAKAAQTGKPAKSNVSAPKQTGMGAMHKQAKLHSPGAKSGVTRSTNKSTPHSKAVPTTTHAKTVVPKHPLTSAKHDAQMKKDAAALKKSEKQQATAAKRTAAAHKATAAKIVKSQKLGTISTAKIRSLKNAASNAPKRPAKQGTAPHGATKQKEGTVLSKKERGIGVHKAYSSPRNPLKANADLGVSNKPKDPGIAVGARPGKIKGV